MKKFLLSLYVLFIILASPNALAAEAQFTTSAYENLKRLHKAIFETKILSVKDLNVFEVAQQLANYEQHDLIFIRPLSFEDNLDIYFYTQLSTKIMILELAIAKLDKGLLNQEEGALYRSHVIYGFNDIVQFLNVPECIMYASQILSTKVIIDLIMLMNRVEEINLKLKNKIDIVYHFPRFVVERIISVIDAGTIQNCLHSSKYPESSIAGALGATRFMISHGLLAPSEIALAFSEIGNLAELHEPGLLPAIALEKKSKISALYSLAMVKALEILIDSQFSSEQVLAIARAQEFALAINNDLSIMKSIKNINSLMPIFCKRINYLGRASIELLREGRYYDALITAQHLDYIVTQLAQSNMSEDFIITLQEAAIPYNNLGSLILCQRKFNASYGRAFISIDLIPMLKFIVNQPTEIYKLLKLILQISDGSEVLLRNFAQAIPLDKPKTKNLMLMDENVFKNGVEYSFNQNELSFIIEHYEIFHKLIVAHTLNQPIDESENRDHKRLLSLFVRSFAVLANNTILALDAELLRTSPNNFHWMPQLTFLSQELANYFNPTQGREQDIFGPELDHYDLGDFVANNQLFNYLIFVRKSALLNPAPHNQIKLIISYMETLMRLNSHVSKSNNQKLKFFKPHDLWLPALLAHLGTLIKANEVDSDLVLLVTNMAITAYGHGMSSATEKELVKLIELIKQTPNKPFKFSYQISSKNLRASAVAAYAKLKKNSQFKPYFKVHSESTGDWTIFVDIQESATKQAQNKFAALSVAGISIKNENDKTTLTCNNLTQCSNILKAISAIRTLGITVDKNNNKLVFIFNSFLFGEEGLVKIDKICEYIKLHKFVSAPKISPPSIKEDSNFDNYSFNQPAREAITRAPKMPKTVEKNCNKEPQPEAKITKQKKSNKSKKTKESKSNNITAKLSFDQKIERQRREAELCRLSNQQIGREDLTDGPMLSGEKPKVILTMEYPEKGITNSKLALKESITAPENRKLLIELMSHALKQMSDAFKENHDDTDLFYSLYSPMLILSDVLYRYIDDVINSDDNFIVCGFSKVQLFMFKSLRDDILKDISSSEHNKQLIFNFNGLSLLLHKHLSIALQVFNDRLLNPASTVSFNLDWPLIDEKIAKLSEDINNDTQRITVKEVEPIRAMLNKFWNLGENEKQSLKARGIMAMAGVLADPFTVKEKGRINSVRILRNLLAHPNKAPNALEDAMNSRLEFLAREEIIAEIINELKALNDA